MVSFVVIAYNQAATIGPALASISQLAGIGAHEIIVVNDGSRDGTAGVVAGLAAGNPRIRLIDLPVNRGRGYARRTGIAAARGGLVATVDADSPCPQTGSSAAGPRLPGTTRWAALRCRTATWPTCAGASGSRRERSGQRPRSPGATGCTAVACSTWLASTRRCVRAKTAR